MSPALFNLIAVPRLDQQTREKFSYIQTETGIGTAIVLLYLLQHQYSVNLHILVSIKIGRPCDTVTIVLKLKRKLDCGELVAQSVYITFQIIQVGILGCHVDLDNFEPHAYDTPIIASHFLSCDNLPTKELDHSDLECY